MIEFKLPALGADMDEGTLLEWKVAPGERVEKGQVVALVDTAKAAVDVEIWQPGTVRELLVLPGEKVPVGAVLATLLEEGEAAPAAPSPAQPVPAAAPVRRPVSPAARTRAAELGLSLEDVAGTGPGGVVTLADVDKAARPAAPPPPSEKPADRFAAMRAAIAAAMARSKREIPHYYLSETVPMARALEWLARENAARPVTERLLPAALQLKAVAVALGRFPELNGWFENGQYRPSERIHAGVAISLRQGGLVAPAILDADRKSLEELMAALSDLVQRTRAGSLRSSELAEASVTVTILGDQGVDAVFGVIYPPQVALVGFGRIEERPWVREGRVEAMPVVTASLSADHRVSDGHRGGRFLAELRDILQRPEELALA